MKNSNATTEDKFNPEKLKLSQNFSEMTGVQKRLMTIPVRKPTRHEFIRIHPDKAYRIEAAVLELKDERETYLVTPAVYEEVAGEAVRKVIYVAMTRQNFLLLWPVRLPDGDGKLDTWNSSAAQAAKLAEDHWVRMAANKYLGAYDVHEAVSKFPDPEWPEMSFTEMLKLAFKDRFIESTDHPVLRKLRGEI